MFEPSFEDIRGPRMLTPLLLAYAALSLLCAAFLVRGRIPRIARSLLSRYRAKDREPASLGGRFEVVRTLGTGSSGRIWETREPRSKRRFVVREILLQGQTHPERAQKLVRALTLASLRHPGLPEIHEVLERPSGLYLAIERVEGVTARTRLEKKGMLALIEAKNILRPVCQALDLALQRGFCHGNLSPTNIRIASDGTAKLLDLGVAALTREPAPSPAEDIFALGVCLYELTTGAPPFRPGTSGGEYIPAVLRLPGVSPLLDDIVRWCLHDDPAQRPATPGKLLVELDAVPEHLII